MNYMDTSKLLYRASEVAEILALGKSKVYELMSTGVLPVLQIGSAKRIPAEALRQWVAEQVQHQCDGPSAGEVLAGGVGGIDGPDVPGGQGQTGVSCRFGGRRNWEFQRPGLVRMR